MNTVLEDQLDNSIQQGVRTFMDGDTKITDYGCRIVGKIGITLGLSTNKIILTHPALYNLTGCKVHLYRDETGYFIIHSEEKVYLYDDKNIGHYVKDRSNIKDHI